MAVTDYVIPRYAFDGMLVWAHYEGNTAIRCRVVCAAGESIHCVGLREDLNYEKWWRLDDVRVKKDSNGDPIYEKAPAPAPYRAIAAQIKCPYQRIAGQIQSLVQKLERRELRKKLVTVYEEKARRVRKIPMARIPEW